MPKKMRYTHLLGLDKRGLSYHQKKDIVWKKFVRGKFLRGQPGKALSQKRTVTQNDYLVRYHEVNEKFGNMGLKGFLQNPSKISELKPAQRRRALRNLVTAQSGIEMLRYKYSVAVPDKKTLKLLSILGNLHGVIEMKTSNHGTGYWAYLLSQRKVSSRVFNVCSAKNKKANNGKTPKTGKKARKQKQNNPKSKAVLAEEAKHWMTIANGDGVSKPQDILKDFPGSTLLLIYPDFVMDYDVISQIQRQENQKLIDEAKAALNGNKRNKKKQNEMENDDDLMWGGRPNDKIKYRAPGGVMSGDKLPSIECLRAFKGNYVVHVGELFGCTWDATNVWGKTTSREFQIELQSKFHKIHQHELMRWPMFRDTLTVWKRNKVEKVGQESMICLQPTAAKDSHETDLWQSIIRQKKKNDKKWSEKDNILAGSNVAKGTFKPFKLVTKEQGK